MKKTRIVFLILQLVLLSGHCFAQGECGTRSSTPPEWIFESRTRSSLNTNNYLVRVFCHLIRKSSGYGLGQTLDLVPQTINLLNEHFKAGGIQFTSAGYEFIDDDRFYDVFDLDKEKMLFKLNRHQDAIDIYILPTWVRWTNEVPGFGTSGIAGKAEAIPSSALIMDAHGSSDGAVVHEMGHCMGLYHTFHGTCTEVDEDTRQCPELVNGSNSSVCGDYVEDTPADATSCKGDIDANGDFYQPDIFNMMSYDKIRREHFSPLQIKRMKDFIERTPSLKAAVVTVTGEISGTTPIASVSGNYRVTGLSVPEATISWSVSSGGAFRLEDLGDGSCRLYPLQYGKTTELAASVYYQGVLLTKITKQVSSALLELIGNEYITPYKRNRYQVNYLPEGVSLSWNHPAKMPRFDMGSGYITLSAGDVSSPWISVTAASATSPVTVKKQLYRGPYKVELKSVGGWEVRVVDSKYVIHRVYQMVWYPSGIPASDLDFCWTESVSTSPPLLALPNKRLETAGSIGHCPMVFPDSIPVSIVDSLIVWNPGIGFNRSSFSSATWESLKGIPYYAHTYSTPLEKNVLLEMHVGCVVSSLYGSRRSASENNPYVHWEIPLPPVYPQYTVFPNPADRALEVTRSADDGCRLLNQETVVVLNLYNNYGLIRSVEGIFGETVVQMSVSDLPEGNYYLNILTDGLLADRKMVIVKH